jgi:hypothetical protein
MRRIATLLALLCFAVATPALADPAATGKSKVSKTQRRRSVNKQDLGLAATMLFFPFLLPLPIKAPKVARVDVNARAHKTDVKGSAIQGKPVPVR